MYNVVIITSRRFPFKKFKDFKQVSPNKYTSDRHSLDDAKRYVRLARLYGFKAYYYERNWGRSGGYRKKYFEKHPAEEYRCVYCGRVIPKDSITIDHIVPVSLAQRSRIARWWLKKRNFESINDERNLVPSCWRCNKTKGKSVSVIWALRARLGQSSVWWVFARAVQIGAIFALIWALARLLLVRW